MHFFHELGQEVQVRIGVAGEMEYGDISCLSVAVKAPVTLFQAGGIPRTIEMQDVTRRFLQVESFRGGISGNQNTQFISLVIEALPDVFALGLVHPSIEDGNAPALLVFASFLQTPQQIVLRGLVFGENDQALIIPPGCSDKEQFGNFCQ